MRVSAIKKMLFMYFQHSVKLIIIMLKYGFTLYIVTLSLSDMKYSHIYQIVWNTAILFICWARNTVRLQMTTRLCRS